MCNYLITFPAGSKTGDILYFRMNKQDRATVYYTIASSYSNTIISSGKAANGAKI